MKKIAFFAVITVILVFGVGSLGAEVILDSDYFTSKYHNLVTFEEDGAGDAVDLGISNILSMASDEYSGYGFTFSPAVYWVDEGNTYSDEAQDIGGSLELGVAFLGGNSFQIDFSEGVEAFGFWVVNNNGFSSSGTPVFSAYGASGLLETASFSGIAIDGVLGGDVEYGFLGIAADEDITSVQIADYATTYDNFMFIVPEPASVLLFGLGLSALVRGKRPRKPSRLTR